MSRIFPFFFFFSVLGRSAGATVVWTRYWNRSSRYSTQTWKPAQDDWLAGTRMRTASCPNSECPLRRRRRTITCRQRKITSRQQITWTTASARKTRRDRGKQTTTTTTATLRIAWPRCPTTASCWRTSSSAC